MYVLGSNPLLGNKLGRVTDPNWNSWGRSHSMTLKLSPAMWVVEIVRDNLQYVRASSGWWRCLTLVIVSCTNGGVRTGMSSSDGAK